MDFAASDEVPFVLPTTPKIKPGLERPLLCTPRENAHNTKFAVFDSLIIEHRRDIHKVVAAFEKRLAAVINAKVSDHHIYMPQKTAPSETKSIKDCGVQTSEEIAPEFDSLVGSDNKFKDDLLKTQTSMDKSLDYKLARGWIDKNCKQTLTHHASWKGALEQISRNSGLRKKTRLQAAMGEIVDTQWFNLLSVFVILLHSIVMGVAADYAARNIGKDDPEYFAIADLAFLLCYVIELMCRMFAERLYFFFSKSNLFDFILVACDAYAQITDLVSDGEGSNNAMSNVAGARIFRSLRLLRAVRIIRVVHFFRELRLMIKCMVIGTKTVIWVALVLFVVIYIFAVYLLDQVSGELRETPDNSEFNAVLVFRFGTLTDACLSLFMTISGGLSWVELIDPLIALHWSNGITFLLFISLTVFVMLNIVSGVFVDCALSAARQDDDEMIQALMDDENSHIGKIRQLFEIADETGDGLLSLHELQTRMQVPEIRTRFKAVGIDVHEVQGLYRLLDVDNSGAVSLEEFITGCMRLREGGGVDVGTLMYENKKMMGKWSAFMIECEKQFKSVHNHLSRLERQDVAFKESLGRSFEEMY